MLPFNTPSAKKIKKIQKVCNFITILKKKKCEIKNGIFREKGKMGMCKFRSRERKWWKKLEVKREKGKNYKRYTFFVA